MARTSKWTAILEPVMDTPGEWVEVARGTKNVIGITRHDLDTGRGNRYRRPPGRWQFSTTYDRSKCPVCRARDRVARRKYGIDEYPDLDYDQRRWVREHNKRFEDEAHDHTFSVLYARYVGPPAQRTA